MQFTPHEYQEQAIAFLLERGCAGLFLDPGLGKTSISLASASLLLRQKIIRGVLVIAPLRPVYSVWPKELWKWDEFKHLKHVILHGENKNEMLKKKADIYIINPEGLRWLTGELRSMKLWPFDMLIVDESSQFKHTNTVRFKTIRHMLPRFSRRVILTGSPAATGLMDLFGQVFVMDRGATFSPYITRFREEYFYQTGYGGYTWALKPGADKEIYKALSNKVLRMSEKDYLKLPPLIINDIELELDKENRKTYNEMENTLQVLFDQGKINAANTGVALMKCRQIAAGGVYMDNGTTKHLHTIKADAVVELLEELAGQPTIVAYEFEHDLERLKIALSKAGFGDVPHIGGGVSAKRGQEIERLWNTGKLPVLLGQPQSISHGLNLQEAGRSLIWHTLCYSYENYDQFIRRVWRQGQTGRVVVHRLIMKNTVDEAVVSSLNVREKGQNALFKALKDYWKGKQ